MEVIHRGAVGQGAACLVTMGLNSVFALAQIPRLQMEVNHVPE